MADAVPVLPVVESVPSVYYATPSVTVTAVAQRWVCPEAVREVPSAVQRVEAERVAAEPEVVYWKCKGRYVALPAGQTVNATMYRRTTHGKATRYHAL